MTTAVFKGFYPYFLPLVIYGISLRIYEKKWTRAETILMFLFLGHALLMLLQIAVGRGDFSKRYLLTGVPLAFGWAGYALNSLSSRRSFFYPVITVCLLFLLQDSLRPSLEHYWKKKKKEEFSVVREIAPVIRQDWQGPALYEPEILWGTYHSPKRPVVLFQRFPFSGYASGGSGISQMDQSLPLPDYRIFENCPVETPYTEIHQTVYSSDKIYRIGKLVK